MTHRQCECDEHHEHRCRRVFYRHFPLAGEFGGGEEVAPARDQFRATEQPQCEQQGEHDDDGPLRCLYLKDYQFDFDSKVFKLEKS